MPRIGRQERTTTRRRVLIVGVVGGFAAVAGAMLSRAALATPTQAAALLAKLGKGTPKDGKVKLTMPEIAENGNTVPLAIEVESPMTAKEYVRVLQIVAEGNPNPGVATFHFTPACGRAAAQIRCRLAQTQKVIAVAEMSDGSLWTAARVVKVTIGGCGG